MSVYVLSSLQFLDLQKKLDFKLKVIGGDISTIPGLSDAIEVCANSIFGLHCSLWKLFMIFSISINAHDVLKAANVYFCM